MALRREHQGVSERAAISAARLQTAIRAIGIALSVFDLRSYTHQPSERKPDPCRVCFRTVPTHLEQQSYL